MSTRGFDPSRLDVERFAKSGAALEGRTPLSQFERLRDAAAAEEPPLPTDEVSWSARGERREQRGGEGQTWLHLNAACRIALQCQRCLQPVAVDLEVQRDFRFVAGEDAAAQLDADSDDDVLALTRTLDLRELIEDELLLALPLVALHETCPAPLPFVADEEAAPENPFAGLAALKKRGALPN